MKGQRLEEEAKELWQLVALMDIPQKSSWHYAGARLWLKHGGSVNFLTREDGWLLDVWKGHLFLGNIQEY